MRIKWQGEGGKGRRCYRKIREGDHSEHCRERANYNTAVVKAVVAWQSENRGGKIAVVGKVGLSV